MLMDHRNSSFQIGFSGDHILENHWGGIGSIVFSCSYSSMGDCNWQRTNEFDFFEAGLGSYNVGDTVGCGIDWTRGIYFFTLNGRKDGEIHSAARMIPWGNSWFRRPPLRFPEETNLSSSELS